MEEDRHMRELAFRYFEGNIPKAGEKQLFAYIERSPERYTAFRRWEKEWIATSVPVTGVEAEWNLLQRRLHTRKAAVAALHPQPAEWGRWKKIVSVAALIALIAGCTWGVVWFRPMRSANRFFTCEVPYGEKSKMTLSDGTVVWLNAGSTLKYPAEFGRSGRTVELDGEGYFEVVKQSGKPFTVQTHGYDIVVKGTKFDVSAYADDPFVTTTLLEGAVVLKQGDRLIRMEPGEAVQLDRSTGKATRSRVNAPQSTVWTENRIESDNITLEDLARKLSRRYDVQIRLADREIGAMKFRVSLRNKETIGDVLEAVENIVPIHVERRGKEIYITR